MGAAQRKTGREVQNLANAAPTPNKMQSIIAKGQCAICNFMGDDFILIGTFGQQDALDGQSSVNNADNAYGLVGIYRNTRHMVFAFRGTQGPNVPNWKANLRIGVGSKLSFGTTWDGKSTSLQFALSLIFFVSAQSKSDRQENHGAQGLSRCSQSHLARHVCRSSRLRDAVLRRHRGRQSHLIHRPFVGRRNRHARGDEISRREQRPHQSAAAAHGSVHVRSAQGGKPSFCLQSKQSDSPHLPHPQRWRLCLETAAWHEGLSCLFVLCFSLV